VARCATRPLRARTLKSVVQIARGNLQTSIYADQIDGGAAGRRHRGHPRFRSQSELPALRHETNAGVKVVAWAPTHGGNAGKGYSDTWRSSTGSGTLWAQWMVTERKGKGNYAVSAARPGIRVTPGKLQSVVTLSSQHNPE